MVDWGLAVGKRGTMDKQAFKADSRYTRQYGGVGLGLSLTRQLVELHGGRLWVESEVGKGSRFAFSLPEGMREEG